MAPELLNRSNPPEYSSDVYSFGIMLNEIIQEEEPYSDQFRNFLGRGPYAAVNYAKLGNRPRISPRTSISQRQKKVKFSISFLHHLVRCFKKTKYTTRCSVKRSTIYKEQIIL